MSPVLRSYFLFVAFRGRGLRPDTQLVAAKFANLYTHYGSTHVSFCFAAVGHFSDLKALPLQQTYLGSRPPVETAELQNTQFW